MGVWKVDQFPASGVKVKNEWRYNSAPPICFHDMQSVKFTIMASMCLVCLVYHSGLVYSEHAGLQRSFSPPPTPITQLK